MSHLQSITSPSPSPDRKRVARTSFGGLGRCEGSNRLRNVRAPEGIIVMLAEQIG